MDQSVRPLLRSQFGPYGEVREWLNRAVSKTAVPYRVPWVRIPPSPPEAKSCRGEMREWLNRRDWKSRVPVTPAPRVRIPLSPPAITIHVPGPLRKYCAGASELSVSAPTVRAVLADLERREPAFYRNVCDETGALRRHLNVFVNSDNVRDLYGVETLLRPGDVVTFLPAVSGG